MTTGLCVIVVSAVVGVALGIVSLFLVDSKVRR